VHITKLIRNARTLLLSYTPGVLNFMEQRLIRYSRSVRHFRVFFLRSRVLRLRFCAFVSIISHTVFCLATCRGPVGLGRLKLMLTRAALLTAEMTGHSTLVITIEDNFGFKKNRESQIHSENSFEFRGIDQFLWASDLYKACFSPLFLMRYEIIWILLQHEARYFSYQWTKFSFIMVELNNIYLVGAHCKCYLAFLK
jgi:hypothetical protein